MYDFKLEGCGQYFRNWNVYLNIILFHWKIPGLLLIEVNTFNTFSISHIINFPIGQISSVYFYSVTLSLFKTVCQFHLFGRQKQTIEKIFLGSFGTKIGITGVMDFIRKEVSQTLTHYFIQSSNKTGYLILKPKED